MAATKGMNVQATVKGVQPLVDRMRALGRAVAGKIGRKAVAAGCKPLVKQAQIMAPKSRTGTLRRSITSRVTTVKKGPGKGQPLGRIGPARGFVGQWQGKPVKPQKYSHLVELGRKAVSVVKKRVLSSGKVGGKIYGTRVRAVPPTHFMRIAFARGEAMAQSAVATVLMDELKKVGG